MAIVCGGLSTTQAQPRAPGTGLTSRERPGGQRSTCWGPRGLLPCLGLREDFLEGVGAQLRPEGEEAAACPKGGTSCGPGGWRFPPHPKEKDSQTAPNDPALGQPLPSVNVGDITALARPLTRCLRVNKADYPGGPDLIRRAL